MRTFKKVLRFILWMIEQLFKITLLLLFYIGKVMVFMFVGLLLGVIFTQSNK